MKKKLIFLTVLLCLVGATVGISFYLFSKEYTEYVRLKHEKNNQVVLINIGELSREGLADLLLSVNKQDPSVIGLDVFFIELDEPKNDSILASALKQVQPILSVRHDKMTHAYFLKNCKYGFAMLEGEHEGFTYDWRLSYGNINHLAYEVAKQYAPEQAQDYKASVGTEKMPLVSQYLEEDFEVIHHSELNSIDFSLEEKIVLIGYLGPGKEDKHRTLTRYEMDNPPYFDTYGVVLLANAIMMILNGVS